MTDKKKLKRAIREHAKATDTSYSIAARNLKAFGSPPGAPPVQAGLDSGDEPVETIPTDLLQVGFCQITWSVLLDGWYRYLPLHFPLHTVGYAVLGEYENGTPRLDTGRPTLIVLARKTPADDSCYDALIRAKRQHPTLTWHEAPAVKNGNPPGARTPYWWMTWDIGANGVPIWDPGKGVRSLEDILRMYARPGSTWE